MLRLAELGAGLAEMGLAFKSLASLESVGALAFVSLSQSRPEESIRGLVPLFKSFGAASDSQGNTIKSQALHEEETIFEFVNDYLRAVDGIREAFKRRTSFLFEMSNKFSDLEKAKANLVRVQGTPKAASAEALVGEVNAALVCLRNAGGATV